MKKSFLLLISITFFLAAGAQINEHSDRRTSITIGGFNPIIPKTQVQLEHILGKTTQHWSIGENIQYHHGLLNLDDVFTGPKISVFGRYYFKDQSIKHGKDYFLQAKGGITYLTNPFSDYSDVFLNPATDNIPMFVDESNVISFGGGLAFGYRNVSCKGWVWEIFLGYHYWSAPKIITQEFRDYLDDNDNSEDYTITTSSGTTREILSSELIWWYGFPVDLQVKVGKILNW